MNEHEARARTAKVVALCETLAILLPDTTPSERQIVAERLSAEQWAEVARLARVQVASPTTVEWVVRALERQAEWHAAAPSDPFVVF